MKNQAVFCNSAKRKSLNLFFPVLFLFLILSSFFTVEVPACTIAVISGSATPDGKPILWKNRDKVDWVKNEVKFYMNQTESTIPYVGIVDSDSYEDTKMWSGVNDDGFSICNSYVGGFDASSNGIFLKAALKNCSTVAEFQTFLTNWSQGNISGNFGVIDNNGGAAMFEINTLGTPIFYRTDADDVTEGYIVMANYNTYGGNWGGYLRKIRAESLLATAAASNNLTHEYIIQYVAKDIESVPSNPGPSAQYSTYNCINGFATRSATVVHGTVYPESPYYTTMWTLLGEPAFGSAVPIFSYGHAVPSAMSAPLNQQAPMNALIESRELMCYSNNSTDINLADTTIMPWPLFFSFSAHSVDNTGIQGYAFDIEDYTFKRTAAMIAWWKSIKRYKVPEDFEDYMEYTTKNIYKCYDNESFVEWNPLEE